MEQLSDEEVEVREEEDEEEEDSDKEDQDLDKMFGAWLGELDKLTQSLDDGRPEQPPQQKAPLRQETNMANFSYRFSIYNINEALNQGENVDLDALMADLCSIEQELSTVNAKPNSAGSLARLGLTDTKVRQKPPAGRSGRQQPAGSGSNGGSGAGSSNNSVSGGGGSSGASSSSSSTRASPAGTIRAPAGNHGRPALASNFSLDDITAQLEKASLSMDEAARQTSSHSLSSASTYTSATMRRPGTSQRQHRRTGSVGTVSEHEARSIVHSSRSSVTSASGVSVNSASSMDSLDSVLRSSDSDGQQVSLQAEGARPGHHSTEEEQGAKLKAENIRVALEKIKEAQVKKLVIRVHLSDESSKTMMVDERQTVRQVLDSLLEKSHCGYSPDWSLVETINELQMERIFEDHENLVENLLNWTRDSQNRLMFTERIEKYALFKNPQNYLLGRKETCEMAERNKEALLEECFGGSSVSVPEMEGVLWLKEDGKKSWKKRYFLLRASGIYYVPKGKAKASRDLVCFLQLDHVNVYLGQDYKSKYKAPTDYCMVLKHPQIQKKSQYIKYLCCDDVRNLQQWINSIRIAKYGKQLYINYQEAMRRTEAAYDWSSLSSSSIKSGSSSSSLPESQSNSSQSDSGVSEMTSTGHTRSQSVVSSIFSDAWRRGTQGEMMRMDSISRPIPIQIPSLSQQPLPLSQSQTPPSRSSYTEGLVPSEDSSPSPPSPPIPPPPPPIASVAHQTAPTSSSYVKYSTLARLQNQNQARTPLPGLTLSAQSAKTNYNTLPTVHTTFPQLPPSPPPPPPPTEPAPGSAMAALKFGPPSPSSVLPPPPPLEEEDHDPNFLPPPPPESLETNGLPPPPPPETILNACTQLSNSGLQQFLSQKFPNMVYDFALSVPDENSPPPPPPPPGELSPPTSLQVHRPLSPSAPPPAPPKTFTVGFFPPQTAPKPSGPSSLPLALSPVSPCPPNSSHGPFKKQQSFSTGHSPNQPPPTLPKQHSLSSKNLTLSPSASSSSVSIAAATSSLVKQIVNQFPGNASTSSLPSPNSIDGYKFSAPQSPPAVKAKPKWQPGGVMGPQSPEFPPPPFDSSVGDFPPPPSASSSKTGSPIKKSPSTSSTGSNKRGPPPTPQRASSMRANSGDTQEERPKKVESLVNKFGQAPQTGTSSSSSSATGSPSKDSSTLPAPLPKPGKLNLANLPLVLQGLQTGQHHQPTDFTTPPPPPPPSQPLHVDSSPDYFPPPPSDFELFPPPPHPSEFHHPPKVAVVNPQPQMQQQQQSATSILSSSSWKQGSLKKGAVPPPSLSRRTSNTSQYDNTISLPLSPPPLSQTPPPSLSSYSSSPSPVPPTSPKSAGPSSLTLKPHFLEDLNRTLKRKSMSRHGSLTSTQLIPSSKMEPMGTMDDMALLPPPPPELMQQQHGVRGQSHTLSRHHSHSQSAKHANISGYATLRRGPPPAPPKRDQSTKLTSDW
ncbi:ras-associated and pleckstrin homology domains-containing protein 1-like isoform X2 [Solea solea]|uniref:ras-associated and pleckstrin homology domains-containing protein 1-like isoform X2 n=1 Tax=Solea solea TaxID=90069 RepID=UPI00272BA069|nr:ras-associated and pleckstrin homology domains-containing protein 1-like isoform X2 [Solea solea]